MGGKGPPTRFAYVKEEGSGRRPVRAAGVESGELVLRICADVIYEWKWPQLL